MHKVINGAGKHINIALIGYGFVGKTFHAPLINSVEGLKLAIVASRDEAKVKQDLPDVAVIASPEECHSASGRRSGGTRFAKRHPRPAGSPGAQCR